MKAIQCLLGIHNWITYVIPGDDFMKRRCNRCGKKQQEVYDFQTPHWR